MQNFNLEVGLLMCSALNVGGDRVSHERIRECFDGLFPVLFHNVTREIGEWIDYFVQKGSRF